MSKFSTPIAPLTLAAATIIVLLLVVFSNKISPDHNFSLQKSNTESQLGFVLGENEEPEQKEDVEQKEEPEQKEKEEEKEQEDDESSDDQKDEDEKISPTFAPKSIKIKTQSEGNKKETEIETLDGKKIKTKVEDDGSTKIEVEHNRLKMKLEFHNGKIVTKAEDEDGKEVDLDEQELEDLKNEVENELEDDGISISSSSAGLISFAKNQIAATTAFPLSIDMGTNQLVVITPAGQKIVAVLPDEAVQNLLDTGIITALDTKSTSDNPVENGVGVDSGVIELTLKDGRSVYEVKGLKTFKMFGFIPVAQPVTAIASTDDGSLVEVEKSFITNIVDLLSP